MASELLVNEDLVDRFAGGMSRAMATRFTRRSFFGKVGRYAAAATVGGSALAVLFPESAYATNGCVNGGGNCSGQDSVNCFCLTGSSTCPSGTCQCGCWQSCDGSGTAGGRVVHSQWCDCCNMTAHQTASCVTGCGNKPKNCFNKTHTGSGTGCNPGFTIRCRKLTCLSSLC